MSVSGVSVCGIIAGRGDRGRAGCGTEGVEGLVPCRDDVLLGCEVLPRRACRMDLGVGALPPNVLRALLGGFPERIVASWRLVGVMVRGPRVVDGVIGVWSDDSESPMSRVVEPAMLSCGCSGVVKARGVRRLDDSGVIGSRGRSGTPCLTFRLYKTSSSAGSESSFFSCLRVTWELTNGATHHVS